MTEKDYKTALRMITYERIHHLLDVEHWSIQRIADDLGLNFRTIKKYLGMSREEFEAFTNSIIQKPFVLEPYKEFIVQRLSLYPDTSAAQMHDWLKENYPKLPALSPKTVYNYVMKFRSDYSIPKNIIYDQDAVFLYDENIGDYVMTSVFGSYVKSCPFNVTFCRPVYSPRWWQTRCRCWKVNNNDQNTDMKQGDKIVRMDDSNGKDHQARMMAGMVVTVKFIDDLGQIHLEESGLALIPGVDEFAPIGQEGI